MQQSLVRIAAVVALVAAAATLRPPMTGLSPLLPRMNADVGLTDTAAAALTTAPLLCFAVGALVSTRVIGRLGIDRTVLSVLVALAVVLAVRPWGGYWWLLTGTVLAALVVAVGNVVMPVLIRARHHSTMLTVTGLYSVALALSSSLSAGTAVPLADGLGTVLGTGLGGGAAGWRGSLAFWAVPTLMAAAVWVTLGRQRTGGDGAGAVTPQLVGPRPSRGVLHHPTAWLVAVFFGIQGLGFYAFVTWYPTVLVRRGMDDALAGGQLSLALASGAVAAFVVPQLARRWGVAPFIVATATLID